jgi:hypothetical protein
VTFSSVVVTARDVTLLEVDRVAAAFVVAQNVKMVLPTAEAEETRVVVSVKTDNAACCVCAVVVFAALVVCADAATVDPVPLEFVT